MNRTHVLLSWIGLVQIPMLIALCKEQVTDTSCRVVQTFLLSSSLTTYQKVGISSIYMVTTAFIQPQWGHIWLVLL